VIIFSLLAAAVILQLKAFLLLLKKPLLHFIGLLFILSVVPATAQLTVSGYVFDITKKTPLEAVSVLSTSGSGALTDSFGRYKIVVRETDSISFSYLNKSTPKYPVATMPNMEAFDIAIHVKIAELPMVSIRQRNYRMDSIQNRKDYAKAFDFRKPGVRLNNSGPGGIGVGLDLNELINMFRFRKNRNMLFLQKRLLQEERDKYINHRYNKYLVRSLTKLTGTALDSFMLIYRPTYEFVLQCNDLELGYYVQKCYEHYLRNPAAQKGQMRLSD
jgi:hypothetical protein